MRVTTLGDLLLDVVVRLEQPLARDADATSAVHVGPAGQAANVAAWAAALGARARCVAKRAEDDAGALATAGVTRRGVEVVGPLVPGRTGTIVSLVTPDGDRTMASDRGVCPDLAAEELDERWFDCDWLHLSGYALMRSPVDGAALRAAELRTGRLSVDLSSWSVIRDFGAERLRALVERLEPDVVFANADEERAFGGPAGGGGTWVRKLGADGFEVDGERYPPVAVDATDPTGAGDALAAGFLLGGAELARQAASRCVAQLGSMP